MTVSAVKISGYFGEISATMFPLDRTRDALSAYAALRWPVGRRKSVESAWKLSPYEAKTVCEGSASQETIDKIFKRDRWEIILPIYGALLGETVEQHLIRERRSHVEHARRIGSLVRNSRSGDPGGGVHPRELGSAQDGGRKSDRR